MILPYRRQSVIGKAEISDTYLPQEVADLIIDQVALHESQATLQACTLVSRSFSLPSRRHLFSNIDFLIDTSHQARANRLLKVLQRKKNTHLVSAIRSLKVTYDTPSFQPPTFFQEMRLEKIFLKSRKVAHDTLKSFGLEKDKMFDLLELLSEQELEIFQFIGKQYLYWSKADTLQAIEEPLARLCSSSALKVLHLIDIRQAPKSLLVAALSSARLKELRLSYVFFDGEDPLDTPPTLGRHSLEMLEMLEMTYLSYPHIFGLFRSVLRIPDHWPSVVFPRLRTLRVSPRAYEDWRDISQYVIHSMPSLENLQFVQKRSTLDHMVYHTFHGVPLNPVNSLRHLKFIITCCGTGDDLIAKQLALARFFEARSLPTTITSIDLIFYMELDQRSTDQDLQRPFLRSQGWDAMDRSMSSQSYANLKKVAFNMKSFHRGSITVPAYPSLISGMDASIILPLLSSCSPRLEVEMNQETIYGPKMTHEYIRFQDCD
ncbi:hypothetical protein CVT26_002955 [Gymnopilus dilepis]|uniref:F-box domain-containing protein n=1 Tax=Gymnopilus dilepis TaxID=231916 RepID=A0A409VR16_9AGAR|nr:hypothetical protein CVT26_002955 [Gymnopilus dilepis]